MNTSGNNGAKLLAMSVGNMGFFLDRLGQDCHSLQFLRELTQNSIEAIQRAGGRGTITWDVDWATYDLEGVYKLSITDDGVGMTGEEMLEYINRLSSSVAEQSFAGNYGVGAKIAAAPRNPHGLIYLSWKDGVGAMIQLCRDPESGTYGVKQWQRDDGTCPYFLPIEDAVKPKDIGRRGTRVVLLGRSEKDDTMRAPAGSPSPSRWVSKYLNSRYYTFPKGITVRAREGWKYPRSDARRNMLRTLTGQKAYLDKHARDTGEVGLTGATAYWWILEDTAAATNNSGYAESAGHMAALYQNELYELRTGRSGGVWLVQFGVTFGYRFVVIYVEPRVDDGRIVTPNTARTVLQINNEPLPWAQWAAEFQSRMPTVLRAFIHEHAAQALSSDHSRSIRERLRNILDLFTISRYRPASNGSHRMDPTRVTRGGAAGNGGRRGKGKRKESDRIAGNIYAVFERKDGPPPEMVRPDPYPKVRWLSVADGTRAQGLMEDRAAQYVSNQNLLLINADFRALTDMQAAVGKAFQKKPGADVLVRDAVRAWYEQALVETVIGVRSLEHSKQWSPRDIDGALSEEALTAAAIQRYHIFIAVRRELGIKLGAIRG